ncbi:MAG: hypothetical protein OEZ21_01325 [Candidatus Bathyarchaeota archaeon]|nr:hypothetical protein [Candidatus Bathyarchaeota archaeon]MDH5745584.1 hypothetical protein [Candidatus Bathyarchaeota archaeon]
MKLLPKVLWLPYGPEISSYYEDIWGAYLPLEHKIFLDYNKLKGKPLSFLKTLFHELLHDLFWFLETREVIDLDTKYFSFLKHS